MTFLLTSLLGKGSNKETVTEFENQAKIKDDVYLFRKSTALLNWMYIQFNSQLVFKYQ